MDFHWYNLVNAGKGLKNSYRKIRVHTYLVKYTIDVNAPLLIKMSLAHSYTHAHTHTHTHIQKLVGASLCRDSAVRQFKRTN